MDLTKNLQKQSESPKHNSMFANSIDVVEHFSFNHPLLADFKDSAYMPFRINCIYGLYMAE